MDQLQRRLEGPRQELLVRLRAVQEDLPEREALLTFAVETRDELEELFGDLSDESARTLSEVLARVQAQLRQADVDLTVGPARLEVTGDDGGIAHVHAALEDAVESTPANLEYTRGEGIAITVGQQQEE
jgi:hypothetical protein